MKPPQLRLQLTGQPAWQDPSGRTGLLSRKDAGLLALLAWEGAVPRERALALLWQDTPPDKAHASLRQRLFRLRRDTGHDLVQSSASLSLAPGVVHDLSEPGPEAQPLLAGLDFGDMQALDEWVQGARAQWDARRVDQLTADAAQAEATGAWARAIACTQRVLALAPLQEHAWRRLMRLHYLRGDRAAAIVAFEQFEQALAAEIGGRPSAETIEQLRQIESAAPPSAPSRRVLPPCL
ncbi:AfsR/SARP family transcriptional regulator, partial [Ideonella sp.]|uniref:AfsR/SARP family transcriptional regulator n=1 Tax=Ideonella sp. TaxID=1929293 RepID=UPI003BB630AA